MPDRPPTSGNAAPDDIGIGVGVTIVGAVIWFLPALLNVGGGWAISIRVFAVILVLTGMLGFLFGLAKATGNKAFESYGVSILLLAVGVAALYPVRAQAGPSLLRVVLGVVGIASLLLGAVGACMGCMGVGQHLGTRARRPGPREEPERSSRAATSSRSRPSTAPQRNMTHYERLTLVIGLVGVVATFGGAIATVIASR